MWVLVMALRDKTSGEQVRKNIKGPEIGLLRNIFFLPVKKQVISDFTSYSKSHESGKKSRTASNSKKEEDKWKKRHREEEEREGGREKEAQDTLKETPRNFTTLCHK